MSQWSSAKAKRVLAALLRIGWNVKRESSSHKILFRPGWPDVVFAFMTETRLAQRCWRELPNILVSSPKTCDLLDQVCAARKTRALLKGALDVRVEGIENE